jgi:HAD superfamily hydrolase (TIGR01549 family)
MIDTVIFDFVNTIAFLTPCKEDILVKYCQENNTQIVSKLDILRCYAELDGEMPYSSVTIKKDSEKRIFYTEYNKKLFNKLDIPGHERFYDFYHSVEKQWTLDKNVCELFNFLKDRKIRIGIISNFDDNLENVLSKLNIAKMLDFVVVSAKVGLEKPSIKFYNYAKTRYNIDTNSAIYIGDSYELDYAPSTEAGFVSFLIDRENIIDQKARKIKNLNDLKREVDNAA